MRGDPPIEDLCQAIHELETPEAIMRFLEDLCTPAELAAMADRWQVVGLLEKGIPYRKINEMTGVSTATITRVARCLAYGAGGYKQILANRSQENNP